MTSNDFAAAQQRVIARQQQREAILAAQSQARREQYASTRVGRLPFPLDNIGRSGLEAWQSIKGREGTRPAFRVGQVDAELLDEELLELLKGQVGEGLKYFGVRAVPLFRFEGCDLQCIQVTSESGMVCRNLTCSPCCIFQVLILGPRLFLWRSFTRTSLHRR